MDLKHIVVLTFQISLLVVVFGYGLRARFTDLLYLSRRPALLVRSLIAVLVVMPLVAVALARWFDFNLTVEIALVGLAISPLPPLLPMREVKAGGGAHYGLGLMVALAFLSIAVVPLAVHVLGPVFGRTYVMTPLAVAVLMFTSILLPLLAGMVTRAFAAGPADRIATLVERAGRVLMPVAVAVLALSAARDVWRLIDDGTVVAIVVFVATGFAVGHLLGGPEPENAAVLAFSAACRHPGTALAVAAANYPDDNVRPAVLLYLAVNIAFGVTYARWRHSRQPTSHGGSSSDDNYDS